MNNEEKPIQYIKRCHDCGQLVKKDRWKIVGNKKNEHPICPKCAENYDDWQWG